MIQTCGEYALKKSPTKVPKHAFKLTGVPNERWALDILDLSLQKKRNLLVMQNYITIWVDIVPIRKTRP